MFSDTRMRLNGLGNEYFLEIMSLGMFFRKVLAKTPARLRLPVLTRWLVLTMVIKVGRFVMYQGCRHPNGA